MVKSMDDWQWSSYFSMIGKNKTPEWLETDWLLSHFGKQRKRAAAKYVDFVREGVGLPPIWEGLQKQIYLGGDKFVNKYQNEIEKMKTLDDIPVLQKIALAKPLSYYQKKYKNEDKAITEAIYNEEDWRTLRKTLYNDQPDY